MTAVAARAAELATAPVISIDAEVDALAALRTMQANQIRHLPVLADGQCVGLLGETDLLFGLLTRTRGPLPTTGELCHRPPPTVDDRTSRADVARIMQESGCDALVVFSGQRVVGVLTAVDLVRSLAQEGN
ncbi:CBS domain-containing protein [Actinocrispum wychmicini]|uniref:CBS domain protein n=1 Tax=Actinocrispum wychmicini TaxID=1213861 RepID=A0A4R2JP82_9PSEU|nr:CBS domain-containing protein [Actinocrispum wychmicini]TCO61953.1 CBS domain protein [Actinocrispum wychmicini]